MFACILEQMKPGALCKASKQGVLAVGATLTQHDLGVLAHGAIPPCQRTFDGRHRTKVGGGHQHDALDPAT